jgi:hypothetical protein
LGRGGDGGKGDGSVVMLESLLVWVELTRQVVVVELRRDLVDVDAM